MRLPCLAETPPPSPCLLGTLRIGATPYALSQGAPARSTAAPCLGPGPCAQVSAASSTANSVTHRPFSVFDEVFGHRLMTGQPHWQRRDFVIHAITHSRLMGNPIGRYMEHHVAGHPSPHVSLTQHRHHDRRNAVVFDFRPLQGAVEVFDVIQGGTIAWAAAKARSLDSTQLLNSLRAGSISCSLNGASAVLHLDAELVVCTASGASGDLSLSLPSLPAAQATLACSAASSSYRPPTPPIPDDAKGSPCSEASLNATAPVYAEEERSLQTIRRWGKAARAASTLSARVSLANPNARCTSFDPVRHVVPTQSAACNDDDSFLQFALEQAVYLGSAKEGRILQFTLPGFPTPQVCIHPVILTPTSLFLSGSRQALPVRSPSKDPPLLST